MDRHNPPVSNPRTVKLKKHLDGILRGQQQLTPSNSALFLEAICIQPVPATCISSILSSQNGIQLVQDAMRFDLSTAFLNGIASKFLHYLQSPDLAGISGGRFIDPIIRAIVDPPIFWQAFIDAFQEGHLQVNAQRSFAWLLLRLISSPKDDADPYLKTARDPTVRDTLSQSIDPDIRTISMKIKNILEARDAVLTTGVGYHPGGRHDNDFEDFRKIAIVPTAEEIMSTSQPFLQTSAALIDPETEDTRTATYLDNQFRLLREDMVYELREEVQLVLGMKKSKRRSVVIEGLQLLGLYCGPRQEAMQLGLDVQVYRGYPAVEERQGQGSQKVPSRQSQAPPTPVHDVSSIRRRTCCVSDHQQGRGAAEPEASGHHSSL